MVPKRKLGLGAAAMALVVALAVAQTALDRTAAQQAQAPGVPQFEIDTTWPKIPKNRIIGTISGMYVDAQDHIWVTHRPNMVEPNDWAALQNTECCLPLPPISEFDQNGNFVQGFGPITSRQPRQQGAAALSSGVRNVPEPVDDMPKGYDWPMHEHGVHVDYKGNVWLAGNGEKDAHVLKFTRDGKFLLQIGKPGQSKGNTDRQNVNQAAEVWVSAKTNEAYVADGYVNRRVIVYDADTGAFKRMWGAYGNTPTDPEIVERSKRPREDKGTGRGPEQFNLVHAVALNRDFSEVYVADRVNNRVQVFTPEGKYLREFFNARTTLGNGAAFDIGLSPDASQTYLYLADNTNGHVRVFNRATGALLTSFGHPGRQVGQLDRIHSLTVDSKGNVYTGETNGRKIQRFLYKGTTQLTSR